MKKIFTILILLIGITGCGKEKQSSDTIRWINGTYAMLTTVNRGDIEKESNHEKEKSSNDPVTENWNDL